MEVPVADLGLQKPVSRMLTPAQYCATLLPFQVLEEAPVSCQGEHLKTKQKRKAKQSPSFCRSVLVGVRAVLLWRAGPISL